MLGVDCKAGRRETNQMYINPSIFLHAAKELILGLIFGRELRGIL
jgi:hypothetical protein